MFNKKTPLLLGVVLGLCLAPVPLWSAPLSTDQIQEKIEETLAQRHPTDSAEWWRKLGPSAPAVIINMYEKTKKTYHRIRLLEGLAWFSDDVRAVAFLKQQADTTSEGVVRNAAVKGVGTSQGVRELEFVAKFLKFEDPQTRLAAAQTVQRMEDPKAQVVLKKFMAEEKTDWLVARLKGDLPRPARTLAPVATSEDRRAAEPSPELDPVFFGNWKGLWVKPKDGPKGLDSQTVVMKLERGEKERGAKGAVRLRGELTVQTRTGEDRWALREVAGEHGHFAGILEKVAKVEKSEKTESASLQPEIARFEVQLFEQAGTYLVELRAPRWGVISVLRKE